MSARYRLPEHLGGGECVIVSEANCGGGCPTDEVIVETSTHGIRLQLNRSVLVEVTPVPQPPHGSIVRDANGSVFERGAGDIWFRRELIEIAYDWRDVCAPGTPVRLIPDPAAGVELPWVIGKDDVGRLDSTQVEAEIEDGEVIDRLYDSHESQWTTVRYTPNGARAKAAALLAAADAVEAGES